MLHELRIYHCAPGRLPDLNKRFETITLKIWDRFGIRPVGFWTVICRTCKYDTDRLTVREWHSLSADEWQERDLAHVVTAILTEPVTQSLPTEWRGAYSDARAREWIRDRDIEGTTVLAIEMTTKQAVGLIILHETNAENATGSV